MSHYMVSGYIPQFDLTIRSQDDMSYEISITLNVIYFLHISKVSCTIKYAL